MARPGARAMRIRRLRVGGRFALAVGVLLLAMFTVTAAGAVGLQRMREQVTAMYDDNIVTSQQTTRLQLGLRAVNATAVQLIVTAEPSRRAALEAQLDETEIPLIEQQLNILQTLIGKDPQAPDRLHAISADFDTFLAMRRAGAFDAGPGREEVEELSAARTTELFGRMVDAAATLGSIEQEEARTADAAAKHTYRSTLWQLVAGAVLALVVGLAVVLLLIRSLIPRIRGYSAFAARIASGEHTEQLSVAGADELTDLGRALNDMVSARQLMSSYENAQTEFIETLQATSSEDEAHGLLKRHVERSLPGSGVTVLTRNNSNNRLEAATAPPEGDPLGARLVGAEPRACLALRLGRTHREGQENQLLECGICRHGSAQRATCEPLLVSGEVIGSVLVGHDEEFEAQQDSRIAMTVAQAAPVLANLRNLALAEFRANNDSLTGLPNKRATEDTFKRMIAQAHRSIAPLSAVMLDLDFFKKINDQFGHGKGDEVLAAVGAAIDSELRESDFAGRFGGEEFLILMPDTASDGAARVAERLREAIGSITVPGIDRDISASLGIAELVEHGGTPTGLLREADRALYAAKAAGRNRTIVARVTDSGDVVHTEASVWLESAGKTQRSQRAEDTQRAESEESMASVDSVGVAAK